MASKVKYAGASGLIGCDDASEILFGHRLECVVEAALFAERGDGVGGEIFSAERACTVRGGRRGFRREGGGVWFGASCRDDG